MFENLRSRWRSFRQQKIIFNLPLEIEIPQKDRFRISNKDAAPSGVRGVASVPVGKRLRSPVMTHFASNESEWVYPQYDHVEIELVFDLESYFARATRAKMALFLKEGWDFVGPEDDRVEYIRQRIRQIGRVTGTPTGLLLLQTLRDLAVHSNAFWLKVRKEEASGGRIRKVGTRTVKPVAGYFIVPPETMVAKVDTLGNVVGWKQVVGQVTKYFSTDDIVHFTANKKAGYPFGVPSVVSAIDDIHTLRHIEENIEVLIRKNLFPLTIYKVGTDERPATTMPDGTSELQIVQELVADLPPEGSLIIPERYDVKQVGSEGRALRVEGYLEYFRQRVWAGLDVSSVDMGIGGTANRGTAQTLSRNLIDIVKAYQLLIEETFNNDIIQELLLESTFSEDEILRGPAGVALKFKEIDTEAKTAKENHAVDMFLKNAITYPELRNEIGLEPLTPEEEKELYWNKFGKEMALITAVDEPYTAGAQAAAGGGGGAAVANKNQPENQAGKRPGPKVQKEAFLDKVQDKNDPLVHWHKLLRNDLEKRWLNGTYRFAEAKTDVTANYSVAKKELTDQVWRIIRQNFDLTENKESFVWVERRIEKAIWRLRDDISSRLEKRQPEQSPGVVFDALEYRAAAITKTEKAFAANFAKVKQARKDKMDIRILSNEDACDICKERLTILKHSDNLAEDKIPPHHPFCKCWVEAVREG